MKTKIIYIAKDIDDSGKPRYAMGYNKRSNGYIEYETGARNIIKFWAKRDSVIKRAKIDFDGFGYTDFKFIDVDF